VLPADADVEAVSQPGEYLYAEVAALEDQNWRPDSLPPVELAFVQRCLEQNEDGDALLFAHLFKDRCIYDYTNRSWYLWQGHFWQEDRCKRVPRLVCEYVAHAYENAAQRVLEPETRKDLYGRAWSLRTVSRIKHVLALAESIMPISAGRWDTNDWLLGTQEGVLDLRNGELRAGRPDDYIRRVVRTTWRGLDEAAPRFEQFWHDLFADRCEQARDELIAFMQRVLGYGITGRVSEHIFLLFYGEEGRNGKDTLMQVLADVLGETVGVVNNDVLIASGRGASPGSANSSLCQLQGRRVAWASETNQGARFDVGQVKYLTGGGTIATRELYGKAFSFQPSHLLILLTNHKPHADASDAAFWERLCPIIFNQRFVDQPVAPNERQRDTTLGAALKAEASGILAWLVRGCLAWQSHGLVMPAEVRQARHDYHEEEDTLGSFIREMCTLDPQASVGAAALYTAYKAWAFENGLKALNNKTFSLHMRKRVQWSRNKKHNFYQGITPGMSEEASDS
jgi:putative DNA primase/helicase